MGAVADLGPYILQSLVALTTVLLALGYAKAKDTLLPINQRLLHTPPAWGFLAVHVAAMGAFVILSSFLFGGAVAGDTLLAFAWLAVGTCGIAAGALFFIPPGVFRELASSAGSAWRLNGQRQELIVALVPMLGGQIAGRQVSLVFSFGFAGLQREFEHGGIAR